MFAYIDKADKNIKNIIHRNYFLTQGDSFSLTATPKNGDSSIISGLIFKIGKQDDNGNLIEIYSKDYSLDDDGVFYVVIEGKETAKWEPTENVGEPYIYEIEVAYIDGGTNTIEQSEFTVWNQIRG